MSSWGLFYWQVIIGSVKSLAPNKQQAIAWTNYDSMICCRIVSLDLNNFIPEHIKPVSNQSFFKHWK